MTGSNAPPAELAGFPPDKPILHIPLQVAVELDMGGEQPVGAEARVDAFLESNAGVFSAAEEAWRQIKTGQQAFRDLIEGFVADNKVGSVSREDRRTYERFSREFGNINVTFGTCKYDAAQNYQRLRRKVSDDQPPETHNQEFVSELDTFYTTETKKVLGDMDEKLEDVPPFVQNFLTRVTEARGALTVGHLYAQFRQDIALGKVAAFLKDAAVVPAFVERLHILARSKDPVVAYPGLLELLATHNEQEGQKNMLQAAIYESAPPPTVYAREFMERVGEGADSLPKELSAAIGVMEVAATVVETEFSMNRADFINLFADRVALWPNELYSRLSAYGLAKTTEQWQQVRDALSPFMRAGRLPAEVSRKVFIPPAPKRSNNQQRATGKSASDIRRPTTLMLARGGMNHEDLVVNTGREPIQHFAVFSARGDKANKRFDLEIVDTVEDLFTWSNLEGYIGRHGSDSTLRPLLHAIIEHLRVDPKGSAHTQRLRGVEYYLGDATDPRAPWRFSPQHFPATSKGPIATRTRVIYDVLNHRGHPTLAVYGAFIKADIEDMSRLPRIR